MAAKEKTNLLEVIPCRSEHITAEREGETIVLSFPRFKYSWMQRFLVPKGMSKERRIFGGTRYGCMGADRWETYGT